MIVAPLRAAASHRGLDRASLALAEPVPRFDRIPAHLRGAHAAEALEAPLPRIVGWVAIRIGRGSCKTEWRWQRRTRDDLVRVARCQHRDDRHDLRAVGCPGSEEAAEHRVLRLEVELLDRAVRDLRVRAQTIANTRQEPGPRRA